MEETTKQPKVDLSIHFPTVMNTKRVKRVVHLLRRAFEQITGPGWMIHGVRSLTSCRESLRSLALAAVSAAARLDITLAVMVVTAYVPVESNTNI